MKGDWKMKTFKVIVILAVVVGVIWWGITSHNETEAQKRIVSEVRPLIEECREISDVPITILGKVLVWDISSNSRSGVHTFLPGELEAKSSDPQITVFMVQPERKVLVGYYSISGEPAYQQFVDVCVVYWPQKKAVGMHSVVSKEPRSSRPVQHAPEYGDPNEPVALWIKTLGRAR